MKKITKKTVKAPDPTYKKYPFTVADRFAVWDTHGCKCFWCGVPLEFRHVTVDHVFPEVLVTDSPRLQQIIITYKLPANFKINSFMNWVPTHSNCNSRKHKKIFIDSPFFIMICHEIISKADKAQRIQANLTKEIATDKTLANLMVALDQGKVNKYDIAKRLKLETPIIDRLKYESLPIAKHLDPIWKILQKNTSNGMMDVTNGEFIYMTSIEPTLEWECMYCHKHGPWNGSRCVSCGRHSMPDY